VSTTRTVDQLVADLHNPGVRVGDTVIVQASLRKIGPVQGRA